MSMSRNEAHGNARPREMAVNYRIRLIGVLRDRQEMQLAGRRKRFSQ